MAIPAEDLFAPELIDDSVHFEKFLHLEEVKKSSAVVYITCFDIMAGYGLTKFMASEIFNKNEQEITCISRDGQFKISKSYKLKEDVGVNTNITRVGFRLMDDLMLYISVSPSQGSTEVAVMVNNDDDIALLCNDQFELKNDGKVTDLSFYTITLPESTLSYKGHPLKIAISLLFNDQRLVSVLVNDSKITLS